MGRTCRPPFCLEKSDSPAREQAHNCWYDVELRRNNMLVQFSEALLALRGGDPHGANTNKVGVAKTRRTSWCLWSTHTCWGRQSHWIPPDVSSVHAARDALQTCGSTVPVRRFCDQGHWQGLPPRSERATVMVWRQKQQPTSGPQGIHRGRRCSTQDLVPRLGEKTPGARQGACAGLRYSQSCFRRKRRRAGAERAGGGQEKMD
mmetsp:Transcript_97329/g.187697  ORF Transcript_97329/g.187697 Transcript_97329/m.187697 type:complete len:204 (+) Transcript_97329:1334-1945(+)